MLLDAFDAAVAQYGHCPAFIQDNQLISYLGTARIVHGIAAHLHAQGIRSGDVVGLTMAQTPLHCCAMLALARLGAISIPVEPNLAADVVTELTRRHQIKCLFCDIASYSHDLVPIVRLSQLHIGDAIPDYAFTGFQARYDSPLRIALTSGTSSTPKGVLHTHGSFMTRVRQTVYQCDQATRLFAPDMHITLSMVFAIGVLATGGTVVFPKHYDLASIAQTIQLYSVSHLILIPSHANALAQALPDQGPIFPSLRHLRLVGATPSMALLKRLQLCCTSALFSPYALTEIGVVSMANPDDLMAHPGTAGKIQPWARLEVMDPHGTPCERGESGEIRIQVDGMPQSYTPQDPPGSSRFSDGWFYPGDYGYLSDDGQLYVIGRSDEILNVAGNKTDPAYIETLLNACDGVIETAVFMHTIAPSGPQLVAAVVSRDGLIPPTLSEQARKSLGLLAPDRYVIVAELPKSTSGKIRRNAVATDLADHLNDLASGESTPRSA